MPEGLKAAAVAGRKTSVTMDIVRISELSLKAAFAVWMLESLSRWAIKLKALITLTISIHLDFKLNERCRGVLKGMFLRLGLAPRPCGRGKHSGSSDYLCSNALMIPRCYHVVQPDGRARLPANVSIVSANNSRGTLRTTPVPALT